MTLLIKVLLGISLTPKVTFTHNKTQEGQFAAKEYKFQKTPFPVQESQHFPLKCFRMSSAIVVLSPLTHIGPMTIAADDTLILSKKVNLDISCESTAWQLVNMKCHIQFSVDRKRKKEEKNVV